MLDANFFRIDAELLSRRLLGKLICRLVDGVLRKARIIETEAYYLWDKGSHASLGYTYKRRALFMPAGTIYMYHSRGGDSLNVSSYGDGNAVLIKSACALMDNPPEILEAMAADNPIFNRKTGESRPRPYEYLCSGQTLLCRSLRLKVKEWDCKNFIEGLFYMEDDGYYPEDIVVGKRRGIPKGRDEDLLLRFVDKAFAKYITK